MTLPSRAETLCRLEDLVSARTTPDAVADWAGRFVRDDNTHPDLGCNDQTVWEALMVLAGADLRVGANEFLHGTDDFTVWLDEYRAAIEA